MTTLVTGATGFIGARLADALVERGDDVRALVRDPSRAQHLAARGIGLVQGDVTHAESLPAALGGVERVYHCAGIVSDWLAGDEVRRVNVEGTQALLSACARAKVRRLTYLSSLAVLGAKHHHGTDESAPYRYTGDPYSDSKIDSEKVVQSFAERGEVETVILRPGFVYGPGDRQFLPRLLASLANRQFAYVGDGSKLLNVIYIDDLAQVALKADVADIATGQAYNLTDGTRTSLHEFVEFVCHYLGLQPPTRHLAPAVAWLACYVLEGFAKATGSRTAPRLNRGRMKFLYYNQHYSIEKARRELGYEPRYPYRAGLPPTLDWFRAAGLLPADVPGRSHAS